LGFGTATFGGTEFFRKWGTTDVTEARRLVDVCLDAGLNFFDTADAYSKGALEEILGQYRISWIDRSSAFTKSPPPSALVAGMEVLAM
jgi:aryl-alcohol dehydrogenase-like predicted oxidoreductase